MKQNSDKWARLFIDRIQVLDPDEWDRSNFRESWFVEEITLEEFRSRCEESTASYPLGTKAFCNAEIGFTDDERENA